MDPILIFGLAGFVVLLGVGAAILLRRGNIGIRHGDSGQWERTLGEVAARDAGLRREGTWGGL
jgi:hypothetical protein